MLRDALHLFHVLDVLDLLDELDVLSRLVFPMYTVTKMRPPLKLHPVVLLRLRKSLKAFGLHVGGPVGFVAMDSKDHMTLADLGITDGSTILLVTCCSNYSWVIGFVGKNARCSNECQTVLELSMNGYTGSTKITNNRGAAVVIFCRGYFSQRTFWPRNMLVPNRHKLVSGVFISSGANF